MSAIQARVQRVIAKYGGRRRALIPILQDIQSDLQWLSPETIEAVSQGLDIPPAHVYSVATFYKSFSLAPRGRHLCTVCMGTACHVRGATAVLEHFERKLGIRPGETSPNGEYTLERVNCLGACALAPLAIIDGRYYGQMSEAKANVALAAVIDRKEPTARRRPKKAATAREKVAAGKSRKARGDD